MYFQKLLWGRLHNHKRLQQSPWGFHHKHRQVAAAEALAPQQPPLKFLEHNRSLLQSETHTNLGIHSHPIHIHSPWDSKLCHLHNYHLRVSLRTFWCGNYEVFGLAQPVCLCSEKPRSFHNSWLPGNIYVPFSQGNSVQYPCFPLCFRLVFCSI